MIYVTCLYLLLASPNHGAREYASKKLMHCVSGWPHLYGKQVQQWKKTTISPERSHRLIRPAAAYRSYLAANFVPSGIPVWPVADCLPTADGCRDRDAGYEWKRQCEKSGFGAKVEQVEYKDGIPYVVGEPWHSVGLSGPGWYGWRRATEYAARQMIREGAEPAKVNKILQAAWQLELACESDCKGSLAELESWKGWDGGYPKLR